jgi:23S rRNA pseudouridine1911/1915/1917 synthase
MRERLSYRVPEERDGCRLDRFLRQSIPWVPARSIRFAIDAGDVRLGGESAKKGRILRRGEEVIVMRIQEAGDWLPVPGDVPGASVLYADEEVVVLSKPVDVHNDPHRPQEKGTLAGYLMWLYPGVTSVSQEPGSTLLTRLDYSTSGAVPAALTSESYEFLLREREKGRIVKTYLCLVRGSLDREMSLEFRLDTEVGVRVRVRKEEREPDPRHWTVVTPVRAVGDCTLVRAVISKGKRHQIRAHLAAAGFPIVGDRRYSAVPQEGVGTTRLLLHAAQVCFTHPVKKETVRVESPAPPEFGSI